MVRRDARTTTPAAVFTAARTTYTPGASADTSTLARCVPAASAHASGVATARPSRSYTVTVTSAAVASVSVSVSVTPFEAGSVARTDDGVVAETDAFYSALSAQPDLYAGVRGLSKDAVAAALARVATARTAETDQARESGEAQEATQARQIAEASLRALSADVASAVEAAFDEQPQRRERLGLFERGARPLAPRGAPA